MQLLRHHPALLLLALLLALAEYVWRREGGRSYNLRAAGISLGVALIHALLRPANLLATTAILAWAGQFAPWQLPADDWRVWVVGFFAVEFAYYWFHRWSHEVAWLWATHAVHHSATEMVLPAAIRLGWTELVSLGWITFVPLALIGLPPRMIGSLLALNLAYQYLLHTEAPIGLGFLERWLNSPAHHRVHHSSDAEFLDCNYGGVLILFDRLFGTFRTLPPGRVLHYGLVDQQEAATVTGVGLGPWNALLRRLRQARDWSGRARIALGPPA